MFDKDKFSKVLLLINNTYSSMSNFAKNAKFDRTYISKYINLKLDNPPTPEILRKIANSSKGLTTYTELMLICGYLETDDSISYLNSFDRIRNLESKLYNKITSTTFTESEQTIIDDFKKIVEKDNFIQNINSIQTKLIEIKDINNTLIDSNKIYNYCNYIYFLKLKEYISFLEDTETYISSFESSNHIKQNNYISLNGLTDEDKEMIKSQVEYLRRKNKK